MFEFYSTYAYIIDVTLIESLLVLSFYVAYRTGMLSLASVGLMAMGAYTSALLTTELGWPVLAGLAAAMGVGALVGFVFALPIMGLSGIYFALASLGLGEGVVILAQGTGFTGGALGITGLDRGVNIVWILPIVIVVWGGFAVAERSFLGRAQRAIDLDERTAMALGINTYRWKVAVFTISGALAGTAGSLEAHRTGIVTPGSYNFHLLVLIIAFTILGGAARWWGPVLVGLGIGAFREVFHFAGTGAEEFLLGVLLVVVMLLAPRGLTELRRKIGPDPVNGDSADRSPTTTEGPAGMEAAGRVGQ